MTPRSALPRRRHRAGTATAVVVQTNSYVETLLVAGTACLVGAIMALLIARTRRAADC